MKSTEQEALDFLRDFDVSTRSYFLRKGILANDIPTALLEAQWQLLRDILRGKFTTVKRQQNYRMKLRQK